MKMKIIASVCLGLSVLSAAPITFADVNLEQRVKQMERELNELKAIIREQNRVANAKAKEVDAKVNEVNAKVEKVASNNVVVEKDHSKKSGFKTKKGTTFNYGGYVKVNGIFTDTSDGLTAENNITNSILVPGAIGTGDGSNDEGVEFDSDAFTSRFHFGTETQTDYGKVKTFIELDFLSGGGNEAVSNSTNPRIRHAFINWDYAPDQSLLVGQTWSTFFNVSSLPDSVDFIGPTSGAIFNRQQQIRWTKKLGGGSSFQLAAENPSTSLSGIGGDIDDSSIPDLVARYNGKSGGHSYSLAVVGRDIAIDSGLTDDSAYGLAANFSGKYAFSNKDAIKYSIAYGNLGRYIALSAFGDGGIDSSGDVDLTTVLGGFVAYQHHWNKTLRSTIQYAYATADLGDGVASTNTETVQNFNLSLVYNPVPKLDFGGALIFADRELENGDDGDLTRLQFTAKYSF